ncbi:MAG: type II toxin-antitoxin system RelE/ParE family toxin [Ignavibacteriota bacterium]|nr:type II toxin-antitoxin system RelE/ParE family toxin [Ignavibacteriales bacterium]MCC7093174.1 type II toxin-antitoxin system RelE/ParE family toxin [Ignavibacteriaceae bacterium]MEB2295936.1 type II toxin-antitoxin system RelE/ParE family toxin [Ignavibacteria bacterium]QKJ97080.1 MAG: type II toxin-antitoxin system RelE/ParE family toxin [Ignavibacteriota bacterium]NUM61757.1 type II toxin-antitoxin system RelE/ParE family toxin [Ignavibacteriaceae bacterium]
MWKIQYTQKAIKSFEKVNPDVIKNLRVAIEKLKSQPDLGKQLTGPLKGLRSLRIGDYRIIYKKEKEVFVILVITIGHRKEVYKT